MQCQICGQHILFFYRCLIQKKLEINTISRYFLSKWVVLYFFLLTILLLTCLFFFFLGNKSLIIILKLCFFLCLSDKKLKEVPVVCRIFDSTTLNKYTDNSHNKNIFG